MGKKYTINDLIDIVETLRGENGCPWDREQTHESIKKSLIEEAYEAIDAYDSGNDKMFANELGDVLLQVVFNAQIAKERGAFDFNDCVNEICTKLISRHSHVFGEDKAKDAGESLKIWEENKRKEKGIGTYTDAMKDVGRFLPALMRAEKVQKKAASSGFEWEDASVAFDSIYGDIEHLKEAIRDGVFFHIEEEMGNLLFSIVNLSRFLKITSEISLDKSISRFIHRFGELEQKIIDSGKTMDELSPDVIGIIWESCGD